jgi:hypothetical protein
MRAPINLKRYCLEAVMEELKELDGGNGEGEGEGEREGEKG